MFTLLLPIFFVWSCVNPVNAVILKSPSLIEKISKDKISKLVDRDLILHPKPEVLVGTMQHVSEKLIDMGETQTDHTKDHTGTEVEEIQLIKVAANDTPDNHTGAEAEANDTPESGGEQHHAETNPTEATKQVKKDNTGGFDDPYAKIDRNPANGMSSTHVFFIIFGGCCLIMCGVMGFNALKKDSSSD